MPNIKKKKAPAKCQAQFERTTKKTGKWRGSKDYVKKFTVKRMKDESWEAFLKRKAKPKKSDLSFKIIMTPRLNKMKRNNKGICDEDCDNCIKKNPVSQKEIDEHMTDFYPTARTE
jgi:hypothetical protein